MAGVFFLFLAFYSFPPIRIAADNLAWHAIWNCICWQETLSNHIDIFCHISLQSYQLVSSSYVFSCFWFDDPKKNSLKPHEDNKIQWFIAYRQQYIYKCQKHSHSSPSHNHQNNQHLPKFAVQLLLLYFFFHCYGCFHFPIYNDDIPLVLNKQNVHISTWFQWVHQKILREFYIYFLCVRIAFRI